MESIVASMQQTAMNARSVFLCSTIAIWSFSSLISFGILLDACFRRASYPDCNRASKGGRSQATLDIDIDLAISGVAAE